MSRIVAEARSASCRRTSAGEVDVGQHVAVHDDRALVEQLERVAHGAARAERRLLDRVADPDAEGAAVAEDRLDALGAVGDREHHLAHAGAREEVDLVAQERAIDHRHHGLRRAERERAKARAFAAREDDRSHDLGGGS